MKKIFMLLTALVLTMSASAQFEGGKKYVGASLTGFDLGYNGLQDLHLGVSAKAGYLMDDNVMLLGEVGYEHPGKDISDIFSTSVGARYYIEQNGIFLGANCKYIHVSSYNDFMPGIEIGYAYFISRTVTVEPSVYYQQSFKRHSDYSTVGLKIGLGIYL